MTLSSEGIAESPQGSTRFVVLRHVQRDGVHFDLMIQRGGTLATWKCLVAPEDAQREAVACERLADHRLAYLDYEGPISGDRGDVTRVDQGVCTVEAWDEDRVDVVFRGMRLVGRFRMTKAQDDDQSWSLIRLGG
ncbi:MAG: DNA polymerase ligase N-terminal domain-containing protein [Planctomycetota bacterium]